ncbi:MAG TPA: hypothetical protein VMP12_01750 [Candidatus Sulfotelmatobacter sp.]|nr:hypothetical protein [Candidatus Sulfotelmatobacter sp.]
MIRVRAQRVFGFLLGAAISAAGIGLLGGCGGSSSTSGRTTAVTVTVSPTAASVATSATQSFTTTVTNDNAAKGVTWAASCATASGCGSLSATTSASGAAVTYTAPSAVPNPATVTLTATSVTDGTKSASATITITAAHPPADVSVTISPKVMGLVVNQALGLTATVTNDVNGAGVTWSASSGTFSAQAATMATYVAPNSPGSGITITATSKVDGTKSATATIAVTDLAGMTTYHNDVSRDGANNQEYLLNTSNVASSTFGKLFSCTVDGAVYAQPLWVPSVNIGGGTHNVIVVATMRDSVYVFDADVNSCKNYWHQTLIGSGETYGSSGDVGSSDIFPDIGILGTPVIDPTTQTVYVVTKTKTSSTNYIQRLHALSLTTGAEATNSPVTIAATSAGSCEGGSTNTFNALTENQRPGLALSNGVVYIAWASHGDRGTYEGWILGYQTANLAAVPSVFVDDPNTCQGGIWMSGGAPAFDSAGNMYVISGNGGFNGTSGSATLPTDFGDSYIKLSTPNMGVLDYFTPFNQSTLSTNDNDVGASGTSVLIDGTGGGNFLVGGSKAGIIYVISRDNMGKYNTSVDGVQQEWTTNPSSHAFSTPAFWNNSLYYFGVTFGAGATHAGQVYTFNASNGMFNTTAASTAPTGFGFAGATPSVSGSSATTNGIVWAIDTGAYGTSDSGSSAAGPAVLHAYDATNLASELWNSSQMSRDQAGNAVKFTVPTVANGKVYIGTRGSDDSEGGGTTFGEIDVYGLLP